MEAMNLESDNASVLNKMSRSLRISRVWRAACRIRALLLITLAFSVSLAAAPSATPSASQREVTFFLLSDVHVGVENLKADPPVTPADSVKRIKGEIAAMRDLVGKPFPDRPGLARLKPGNVSTPQGLLILGDLTDGHKELPRQEEQWAEFESLFPGHGLSFGDRTVPVFSLAGNHDGVLEGPARQGLVKRNRQFSESGHLAALSSNGVHYALKWGGVHLISVGLCAAETTDAETPFKYGKPGPGSWNDPQGAFSFLKGYLAKEVGKSGQPVILMQHYGFDGFSMNDWNWWTPKQRRALYELLADYNVAAIFHGHNHHAEHYQWPDPQRHAADLEVYFDGKVPASYRQYDVISCGSLCWVFQIKGDQLVGAHHGSSGWATDPSRYFVKSLSNPKPAP